MTVEKNKVVAFHYTLSDTQGEQIESSKDKDAMEYLHGASNIIPGLEKAMEGREAGDEFSVTVEPEEAYGTRSDANIQRIPLKRLGKIGKPKVGQVLGLQTNQGPVQVTVVKVGKFNVDVDANHPLSGQALTFDVEIVSVRDAAEDELGHGHSHGPGGHDHG
jgi:FKBP-type peptidyl-prolyl cis-trans isomerase SlyD